MKSTFFSISFLLLLLLLLLSSGSSLALVPLGGGQQQGQHRSRTTVITKAAVGDYLGSLNGGSAAVVEAPANGINNGYMPVGSYSVANGVTTQTAPQDEGATVSSSLAHAPRSYFDIPKLTPKGPRNNPDVGEPHDSSRKLAQMGMLRSGSWWCAEGGWPSPNARATTEIFFVLSGHGCLTDMDGARHFFGPGDTVLLPKGWSGRWDVMEAIHKVWFVVDHLQIEEYGYPIRVLVTHYHQFAPQHLKQQGIRGDALDDTTPSPASSTLYDVGPTKVGIWTCSSGSFPMKSPLCGFHVLEGVLLMHNDEDATTQRVVAGDTVVIPKGWTGYWDVIEPVKKLWVVVSDEDGEE
eukprot:CAMPEP_0168731794 /NCGR_PEP_ID=MMETSP0724-20121128/7443_1 /TAXON_ID=265536 /ORGANISM="Amphiprora sp., Strain CCMP467" /LENGTH=350 /DNA_ID=CAMNT_0008778801 /DNA_START=29 /DNA_END=1081 /DNA_ORIENTATION=+